MKNLYLLYFAFFLAFLCACSDQDKNLVTSNFDQQLITTGWNFAKIHNECIDSAYESIISNKKLTRSNDNTVRVTSHDVIVAVNNYISRHVAKTRGTEDSDYVSESDYKGISIEDLRSHMNAKELRYAYAIMDDTSDPELLLQDVLKDNDLDPTKKQAVIAFITTYVSSSQYWQENFDKWHQLNNEATRTSHIANWKHIAIADAYYGYMGMLASGLNIWVGGGSAAAGSILSALK